MKKIDQIFLDYLMPLNGIETAKILRNKFFYKGPITMMSSNSFDNQTDLKKSGFNFLLEKPFSKTILLEKIFEIFLSCEKNSLLKEKNSLLQEKKIENHFFSFFLFFIISVILLLFVNIFNFCIL